MAKAAIPVQQSRFALLKVDDDSDAEEKVKPQGNSKQSQQNAAAKKKKNRKKKGAHDSDHGDGKPSKGKQGPAKEEQWEIWTEKDQKFVQDQFEKDLETALLESRIMKEKKKQEQQVLREILPDVEMSGGGDVKEGKKKKKKDKPVTMSLEEFNQFGEEGAPRTAGHEEARVPPTPDNPREVTPQDKKFFSQVEEDASRIIRQEKIQEDYQKHYATEHAMTSKYQEMLSKKDQEIQELRERLAASEEELQATKKRSARYLKILQQGELKDKAEVICDMEKLTQSNNDLNEQILTLTTELEKEKTQVHTLKAELQRLKGSRHGGK